MSSPAAAGSPQAMNSGTIKPSRRRAEAQRRRPAVGDLAAGRGDDGVARRDVPFAGRRQARIDVGAALGDPAEFDRRAERLCRTAPGRRDEGFGPASPCERLTAAIQGSPRGGKLRVRIGSPPRRTLAFTVSRSAPRPTSPRQISPSAGAPICRAAASRGDQRDIDGEFVAAGDEFLRAVERIDQEEAAVDRAASPVDALLGQRRNIRQQAVPGLRR